MLVIGELEKVVCLLFNFKSNKKLGQNSGFRGLQNSYFRPVASVKILISR